MNYRPIEFAALIVLAMLALLAFGAEPQQLEQERTGWPETENQKSKDDFGAWLLVTPDIDWQEKWETPSDTVPSFNESKNVKIGGKLFVLTFFANPKANHLNQARVDCQLTLTRPDGTVSVDVKDIECINGEVTGDPRSIRLSPAFIQFTAEETAPLGEWTVSAKVKDVHRSIELSLKATFTVERN